MADPVPARLGLGTAQLGSDYGVANQGSGRGESAAEALLRTAGRGGVGFLDTAPGYGPSEDLVGRLRPRDWPVRIVTKTPVFSADRLTRDDGRRLIKVAEQSCARLGMSSVHGLLVHHGTNLLKPGFEHLVDALAEVKARGLARNVGYSAYAPREVEEIARHFTPDIVQLPLNLLDQRILRSGTLAALGRAGVEVHVRSVMLQGLLAMDIVRLPEFFAAVQGHLGALHGWLDDQGVGILEACLGFVLGQAGVSAAIIGGDDAAQFESTLAAAADGRARALDYGQWAISDERILNPSAWPSKEALNLDQPLKEAR